MKFTPNHGWPVAEEIDVVKQYPTTVDQPFKDALDLLVPTSVNLNASTFSLAIDWPGLSVRASSHVANTDVNSNIVIPFDTPFANACLNVVATLGDITGPTDIFVHSAFNSTTTVTFAVRNNGTPPGAGVPVRVNYIAIGY